MKNLHTKYLFMLIWVILAVSCKKEGCMDSIAYNYDASAKKDDGSCKYNYQYSFKTHTAQGKINGKAWEMKAGGAEVDFWDSTDITIDLFNTDTFSVCDAFISQATKVIATLPKELGVREFKFSFSDPAAQTATLIYYEETTPFNIIAIDGAIELMSIGDSVITGRIDAYVDEDNYVNGVFTLDFCQ